MQPILAGKHSEQLSPWQWGCALVASHNLVYWGAEVVIAKVLPAPKTALLAESEFLSPWGGVSHSDHNKELRFEGWVYQDENNADDALRIANIFEQLLKVYGEPLGIWP